MIKLMGGRKIGVEHSGLTQPLNIAFHFIDKATEVFLDPIEKACMRPAEII